MSPSASDRRIREVMPLVPEAAFTPERVRGCLLGGAVGDALGAPVEFLPWSAISQKYGPSGIQELDEAYGRIGAVTDDTQMTLFTAEGILRGITRGVEKGIGGPSSTMPYAYLRWLYTQDGRLPAELDDSTRRRVLGDEHTPSGWLITVRALHSRRAPGNTCLAALKATQPGEHARNDRKGCGSVMRVAPIALVPRTDYEDAWRLALDSSVLTHGHPTGQLAAAAFVWILLRIRDRASLESAALDAIERVRREPDHAETSAAVERGLALRRSGEAAAPHVVEKLGRGDTAEEALAIALFAALHAGDDFATGVRIAVNHSGDSDSTGSIAGQLLGAMLGESAIPSRWLEQLELREEIAAIADDLAVGYREGEEWWARYPGY